MTSSRDKIEQHLIQQRARAVQAANPDVEGLKKSRCQYRTSEGLMCAAGCLIPDGKYKEEMEGTTAHAVLRDYPGVFPDDITDREITAWQNYHDNSAHFGHSVFSYSEWLAGKEDNHPSKFKEALAEWLQIEDEW